MRIDKIIKRDKRVWFSGLALVIDFSEQATTNVVLYLRLAITLVQLNFKIFSLGKKHSI